MQDLGRPQQAVSGRQRVWGVECGWDMTCEDREIWGITRSSLRSIRVTLFAWPLHTAAAS